jgi:methionine sulfoxide reductase heme-binding subunit
MIPEGPLLWYVNRSTGVVLVVLLTATVLLGVWSSRGDAGTRLPRFAVQALHRNLGLLTMTMLTLHIATAVLDEYVDIRWWQAVLPWQLAYEPLWLALGIVGFDLLLAVLLTSMLRSRFGHRAWRSVHLFSYAIWAVSVVHGLGIGTDNGASWARWTYGVSTALVVLAIAVRLLGSRRRPEPSSAFATAPLSTIGGPR